ncbi:mannosyltransferase YkcB-related protein [Tsukamurella soli]|uniref:hypothetical protein n=1 Tax=Tsukamurella soli TaxID=644556 RepID=UPI00361AD831
MNGSSQAASLELSTGKSVIAVGGFTGQDPSPSLAQFQSYVRNHDVSYYVMATGRGGRTSPSDTSGTPALSAQQAATEAVCQVYSRGNSTTDQVVAWVQKYFTPTTVGGQTVYDLTNPPAAAFAG